MDLQALLQQLGGLGGLGALGVGGMGQGISRWSNPLPTLQDLRKQHISEGHEYSEADLQCFRQWRNVEVMRRRDKDELSLSQMKFLVHFWQYSENELFEFIVLWVLCNEAERAEKAAEMLLSVRYCLMEPQMLKSIKADGYYQQRRSESWTKLVDEAIEYQKLPIRLRVLHDSEQSRVRAEPTHVVFLPLGSPSFIVRGYDKSFYHHQLLFIPKGRLPTWRYIVVNNFMLMFMPTEKCTSLAWYLFDPRTLDWVRVADEPAGFRSVRMAQDGKYAYIVGGKDESETPLDLVQRYDFKNDKWLTITHLPIQIHDHSACIMNNKIYISGGLPRWFLPHILKTQYDEDKCRQVALKTMYCYDIKTKEWDMKASMLRPRWVHNMNKLKIDGQNVLVIINKDFHRMDYYTPSTNQWSVCNFQFTQPPPTLGIQGTHRAQFRGNKIYLPEVASYNDGWKCLVKVTIPEQGRDAKVEYLIQFPSSQSQGEMMPYVPLSIYYDTPPTKCPKK